MERKVINLKAYKRKKYFKNILDIFSKINFRASFKNQTEFISFLQAVIRDLRGV